MISLNVDRQELHRLWDEVIDSKHFTEGRMVRKFEEEVEDCYGMSAVAVNSCGSGLFAMFKSIQPSSDVVVPTNTFYATGAMAIEAGHSIVLADVAPGTPNCGLEQIKAAATKNTKIVVLTHVGGWLAPEYPEIAAWCRENDILLIEDAAHAIGACLDNATAGSFGDAAVLSLYPTKAMPVGEGGVILTARPSVAEKVRKFRDYGKSYHEGGLVEYSRGFNLRMDEWTAAVALLQMRRLPEILERRQEDAYRLSKVIPRHPAAPLIGLSNWYKYPVKAEVAEGLEGRTGSIYRVTDQLTRSVFHSDTPLPNAGAWAEDHVCLMVGEAEGEKSLWETFTGN